MTEEVLRVGVIGARGRMGSEVCQAVDEAADMDLVPRSAAGSGCSRWRTPAVRWPSTSPTRTS